MNTNYKSFYHNPTLKTIIIFSILWIISNTLLILSMTDLFTESLFQKKYLMIYFLMIGSTIATGKLFFNYWKNNNLNSSSTAE
jgi:uncharacterized membrane protein YjjP (DUF1212 family)